MKVSTWVNILLGDMEIQAWLIIWDLVFEEIPSHSQTLFQVCILNSAGLSPPRNLWLMQMSLKSKANSILTTEVATCTGHWTQVHCIDRGNEYKWTKGLGTKKVCKLDSLSWNKARKNLGVSLRQTNPIKHPSSSVSLLLPKHTQTQNLKVALVTMCWATDGCQLSPSPFAAPHANPLAQLSLGAPGWGDTDANLP